jgi:hypothetical protein
MVTEVEMAVVYPPIVGAEEKNYKSLWKVQVPNKMVEPV